MIPRSAAQNRIVDAILRHVAVHVKQAEGVRGIAADRRGSTQWLGTRLRRHGTEVRLLEGDRLPRVVQVRWTGAAGEEPLLCGGEPILTVVVALLFDLRQLLAVVLSCLEG